MIPFPLSSRKFADQSTGADRDPMGVEAEMSERARRPRQSEQGPLQLDGKLLMIYICIFHVLNHLLLIYICKLHWNLGVFALCEAIYNTVCQKCGGIQLLHHPFHTYTLFLPCSDKNRCILSRKRSYQFRVFQCERHGI